MFNLFYRIPRATTFNRTYATFARTPHGAHSRLIITNKYVQRLRKESQDPIWSLLEILRTPSGQHDLPTLAILGIPEKDYSRWRRLTLQPDIDSALIQLRKRGYFPDDLRRKPVPPWVVFYLVSYSVRTPSHANTALLDLVWDTIKRMPKHLHGPLLIFTVLHLSRFSLVIPIRQVVDAFLTTPLSNPTLHFNLFLQALSSNPLRSVENARIVVTVLKAMASRQIKLFSDTYNYLLNDRFVTLELTRYLRERMTQEGVVPTAQHLSAYLNIFAKNGAIHDAQEYHHAIHDYGRKSFNSESDETALELSAPGLEDDESGLDTLQLTTLTHRANTQLLAAQEDRASAFNFLRRLAQNSSSPPDTPELPPIPVTREETSITPVSHSIIPKHHQSPKSSTPRLSYRKTLSAHDYTAALTVASRDPSTTPDQLVNIFDRAHAGKLGRHIRPTTVTYTVLMRGLYRRKSFGRAEKYWRELLSAIERPEQFLQKERIARGGPSRITRHTREMTKKAERRRLENLPKRVWLDRESLTIGLQILTRVGKPHVALAMLEKYARRDPFDEISKSAKRAPVRMTSVAMNEFLVALNRISRPDIVFKIWDHMFPLYNIYPDDQTLCILLQSARLATKLDDTFTGAMAHLALKNPFRKTSKPPESRGERIQALEEVAGTLQDGVKIYQNAIWNDQAPFDVVRRIFLQVVWGTCPPDRQDELYAVLERPPAKATRASADSDPMTTFGVSHHPFKPMPATFNLPSDILNPNGSPWYPKILLTDSICFNYLMLICVCNQTAEVPYVLGWMRTLGVRPADHTVALALVLWAEVSALPPLMESWQQRRRGAPPVGEYAKLAGWLKEWLHDRPLPHEKELRKWFLIANRLRERE